MTPELTSPFDACVPVRVADEVTVRLAPIDARARWMLAFIDGRSALATVLASAGLPIEDAREAVNELVLQGIVTLGGDWWSTHPR
jgi:hypothetical protein